MVANPGSFTPGMTPVIADWKVSGPIATGTYNPDWNKTAQPDTSGTDAAKIAADAQAASDRAAAQTQAAADAAAADRQRQQQQYERDVRQNAAMEAVKAAFSQYGLESLYAKITEYAKMDWSADTIAIALRQTPEYKKRFPAAEVLASRGRAISEADYINYERTAASLEQQYGIPKGMLMGNVTNLLTNEVSALELGDRVQLAAANSLTAPQDLKDTMMRYYNLDPSNLTAYYLDPSIALPYLEKRSAAAALGVEAYRQGIGIDVVMAEDLQGLGINTAQARQGFAEVAGSTGLQAGKGETVTQGELVKGTFGNEAAANKVERVAKSRAARFAGGGGFVDSAAGISGLGASGA
jgi:hypothetical protein